MTDKISYYAIVDESTSRERPRTVLRRIENAEGTTDEMFSRDLTWEFSPLLYSAERGDTMLDFVPIGDDEAERIVARIRSQASPED
ncbi:MAG TPA: hypothetical protein VHZ33_15045 [Trebonia sp.]|jgi:hypothetical protein|nr:hypothetical protein [Trebonia sp.]